MGERNNPQLGPVLPAIILGAGAGYVLDWSGPILRGPEIDPVSAAAALVLGVSALTLLTTGLRLLSRFLDWVRVRKPTGLKGTAGFIRRLREIRHELEKGWGPYWGVFRGEPVIAHFESSAYVVGPSGVGKTTRMIQTNALALKDFDKTIIDFKSDLTPVLMRILAKYGDVKIVNLGGLFTKIVGEGDEYNPLHIVADNFWHPGGLQDISDTVFEMCLQLYPEPKGGDGKDDNRYFRDGSRNLMAFAIQMAVLIHGYDATLGHVVQMLNDRESLLLHAQWAAGILEVEGDAA